MNKKILVSTTIGVILSFAGLYLALRNVPFSELFAYFKTIQYVWIIPAIFMVMLSFVLRVLRWQQILSSSRKIRFMDAYHPLLIGFMINCILPGRVGEIARPAILKQRSKFPFVTGIATVAAERVFDLFILLGLFIWALTTVDFQSAGDISFHHYKLGKDSLDAISRHMAILALLLVAGIITITVKSTRDLIIRFIKAIPQWLFFLKDSGKKWVENKICRSLISFLEDISSGFTLVRQPKKIMFCTLLTALIWTFQAYSYLLVVKGCPGISLSFVDILTVMIIICFFIALPSVPGFWGLWEAGGVFALGLFGIESKEAAGFTLTNHVVQMVPVIIMGWVSAITISVNIRKISYTDTAFNDRKEV